MTNLPKSLTVDRLLELAVPGDTTLGEMRAFIIKSDFWLKLDELCKGRARLNLLDNHGKPLPDAMLLSEFRKMVAAKTATISIDDGQGGQLEEAHG